jgi:Ca2+-binding RTX toxin-like protein
VGPSGDGNDKINGNFFNKTPLKEITSLENGRISVNKGDSVDKRICKDVGPVT